MGNQWSEAIDETESQVVQLDFPKPPTAKDVLELALHFGLVTEQSYQNLKTSHK